VAERRRVAVVHDPDDTPLLSALGWDDHRPLRTLIVRPTPGAKDQGTLVRDLLAALGKNPFPTRAPAPLAEQWALCHAWIAAASTADVVIDRAHRLPVNHLLRLAALAREVGACLWLLWPAPAPEQLARVLDQDAPDTVRARVIDRFQAHHTLTERQRRYRAQRPARQPWPHPVNQVRRRRQQRPMGEHHTPRPQRHRARRVQHHGGVVSDHLVATEPHRRGVHVRPQARHHRQALLVPPHPTQVGQLALQPHRRPVLALTLDHHGRRTRLTHHVRHTLGGRRRRQRHQHRPHRPHGERETRPVQV